MLVSAIIEILLIMAELNSIPPTPCRDVADTYHGVTVVDPYRWLEDSASEQVRRWSDAQNAHTRTYLDNLPDLPAIRARVSEIMLAKTYSYGSLKYVGDRLVAVKRQPHKQQPFLLVMNWPSDPSSAKVLVDPNELDANGGTAIDWYVPSPDGNL